VVEAARAEAVIAEFDRMALTGRYLRDRPTTALGKQNCFGSNCCWCLGVAEFLYSDTVAVAAEEELVGSEARLLVGVM